MTWQSTLPAVIGGLIIGGSAVLMMWTNGRILGVSGFAGGILAPASSDRLGRLSFVLGLIVAGAVIAALAPAAIQGPVTADPLLVVGAGLAVGFGARLSNGCTSGHGVCGMARLSRRSLATVVVFMAVAMATVFVTGHLIG